MIARGDEQADAGRLAGELADPSGSPAYQRIEDDLRAKVASGQWAEGVMLPGRKALAAEYGVSVPTIERAVAGLLADGTLRADGRRGTFAGAAPGARAKRSTPKRVKTRPIGITRRPMVAPNSEQQTVIVGIVATITPAEYDNTYSQMWSYLMVSAVEREVARQGGRSACFNLWKPDGLRFTPIEGLERLLGDGADVVIFVSLDQPHASVLASLHSGVHAIFVGDYRLNPPGTCVYYNCGDEGFQAGTHLITQGCTELVYVSPHRAEWSEVRLAGVRKAIAYAGLPQSALIAAVGDLDFPHREEAYDHLATGEAFARQILAVNGRGLLSHGRGVVAANDRVAVGVVRAAAEHGLVSGEDFLVIGFDDHEMARSRGISSMRPPLEGLGREAARLAIHTVREHVAPMSCCLTSELIARSSTRSEAPAA